MYVIMLLYLITHFPHAKMISILPFQKQHGLTLERCCQQKSQRNEPFEINTLFHMELYIESGKIMRLTLP